MSMPSAQNVLDIFAGEWSTAMPEGSGLHTAPGTAHLFDTHQIKSGIRLMQGLAGKTVLELGPMEGAHSAMLQEAGAQRVLAIEANTRNFLKCLCIKEIFRLHRVEFQLGNFMKYLETREEEFDLAVASGVLYHMTDPLLTLQLVAKASKNLILWTHYYDEAVITANPKLAHKFSAPQQGERDGFQYTWVTQSYKESLEWDGFCGGAEPTSVWLTRDSILNYLRLQGYVVMDTELDNPLHQNGPSFAVYASKEQP